VVFLKNTKCFKPVMSEESNSNHELQRTLSLPQVMFYGLGTILGAGIYALVGKVAGESQLFTPAAFITAAFLASFSALSYAELSSRFPQSSGAANYVHQGFSWKHFSLLTGLAIAFSGIVSGGVLVRSFAGYFRVFFDVPHVAIILLVLLLISGLAIYGIKESAMMITLITLVEVAGILLILWVARGSMSELPSALPDFIPKEWSHLQLILPGAFLAFYAFIGFEDMVNIAEETQNPSRTLPIAILTALGGATLLYLATAVVAVLALPIDTLERSDAPLALIYEQSTGKSPVLITIIGLFAVVNGVIAQIIMASRMLYGMSRKKWLPAFLGKVSRSRKTPLNATVLVSVLIFFFAVLLPIKELAQAVSFVTLTLFALINAGLLSVKRRQGKAEKGTFQVPMWVPAIGLVANTAVVIQQLV